MRLIELQNESDSLQACAAIGRGVPDTNLRGWGAILLPETLTLAEGLRQSGLTVLQGAKGALALGSIAQIWSAARSIEPALEREQSRNAAQLLMNLAANVESPKPGTAWRLPRSRLPGGRTLIMGIVNATPDSFSDGGAYDPLEHALRLAEEGADIIDIGGESTRPGAQAISPEDERTRTEPAIKALVRQIRIPISIDTTKPQVAKAAVDAGAEIVNIVSGDATGMPRDAAYCLMHMRGTPSDMQSRAVYQDLHGEVLAELQARLEKADIPQERIALDPGLGFAKTAEHNVLLLRRLRELTQLGRPLLVGPSRKSFIGKLTARKAPQRVIGSVAAAAVAAVNGAAIVRVHDVKATREALQVADAIRTSSA
ncbi:MAG: dihydropteroate synthase [Myxococcales bacterium]